MGNQIVLPDIRSVPFTEYKVVSRAEMNAYYSLLRAYNAPFKQIVSRGENNTIQLSPDYSKYIYNPPQHLRVPPWVKSEVDVLFQQDISTYQTQLVKVANNLNDGRMVRVLNNPPEPQQPPAGFIKETGIPPTPYTPSPKLFDGDPAQQKYIKTWLEGIQYVKPGQDYKAFVAFNPPAKGADFATALRHYTILYEQIRGFHALNTGGEVFTLQFDPPDAPDAPTASGSSGSIPPYPENFVDMTTYTCVKRNTEREQWYLNQVIDIAGKRKLQAEFCKQKGLKYNITGKCSLFDCEQADNTITKEAGSEINKLYAYNQYKFSASTYPEVDNSDYSDNTQLKDFKQTDIDNYYKRLAKYNFNWINNNGWRKINNNNKIYNPPIPAWMTDESATGADKQFLNAIDEFNTQALEKLQRFNNYEPMNLPEDFGALPDMPPYPNALYKMLEKPQDYVVPSAIGTIPQESASGTSARVFRIPIEDLPKIYNSVKKQKPVSASASQKPKCGTKSGSESCMLYDDEISPAAQKLLDMMMKKKVDRVSTAGYEYAMSKPEPPKEIVAAKLNSFYDSIRPGILKNVKNLLENN
jgi:hypothetical protein